MIRLQRWLDIPVPTSTPCCTARACEGSAKEPILINDSSLRALGVFGYLRRRYGITPETFAAWLYQLPVHGVGPDAGIVRPGIQPAPRLQLATDPGQPSSGPEHRRGYPVSGVRGAGHGRHPAVTGSAHRAKPQRHLKGLRRDLAAFSSFYRQATIPALFGLPLQDIDHLAQLLGGEYRQQLVSPNLRLSGSNAPADFLDVLMQLDWAVTWFKGSGTDVQQIRRHLILDGAAPPSRVQLRLRQLEDILHGMQQFMLPGATLAALDLPQPEAGARPLAYTWSALLAKGLLGPSPTYPEKPGPEAWKRVWFTSSIVM